jgi:hypothetical protein
MRVGQLTAVISFLRRRSRASRERQRRHRHFDGQLSGHALDCHNEIVLRFGLLLRELGRRHLPDQDRAVGLLLAVKLARLRQAHVAQVLRRMAGRHLPVRNDVDQRQMRSPLAFLTGPAHGYSTTFGTRKK